jgi:RHS repeat-associated protein
LGGVFLKATTGTYCWGYQYSYDAWGNLLSQAGWSPTYNGCTETTMGAVTADGNNHISAMSYDASGNTLGDGNYTYTWDGESQMKTAAGVTYAYDGDGRRAAKVGSKLYWYGSGGEILSETDAAGNTLNEYVFFGGKRVALVPATGGALYYAEDLLGSSRVMVQANGTLCYDADFTPFGGEVDYTSTCAQNYKFEGKERDTETENDDFGARYYSWRFGRWLSSDWSAVPAAVPYANLTNPQTLNLYSMVGDDPESFADLDGHGETTSPSGTTTNKTVSPSCSMTGTGAVCPGIDSVNDGATPPQNAAAALPLVLPQPVVPPLDLGKIITTAVNAFANLAETVVTTTTVSVAATIGYLISPGSGAANNQNDTMPPLIQPMASHANTNPFAGPVSAPVTVVDPKGNAVPVKPGQQIQGSKDGRWAQVKDANGRATGTRIDGGHSPARHSDPRALAPHAHVPGVTNADGTPWLPINQ